jgi:Amt family ammonium transporter
VIDRTIGFRLSEDDEVAGVDQAQHAETAYDFLAAGSGLRGAIVPRSETKVETEKEGANA